MGVSDLNYVDIEGDPCLNLFVYGQTGVGKTHLLGTAQACEYTSPILVLDIDGGTATLRGTGIKVIRPQSMTEIQEIYNFFRYENNGTYNSVGIDTLTETQRKLSMGEILGILGDDSSYSSLDGHVPPNRYDWLSSGEQMRRVIRAFRDLAYLPDPSQRVHVLFTSHEKVDDKSDTICPSLPGQLGLEVGGSVDLLGRLTVRKIRLRDGTTKKVRSLALDTLEDDDGPDYLAKVRAPMGTKFPSAIREPTVDKLIRLWMAEQPSVKSKGGSGKLRRRSAASRQ